MQLDTAFIRDVLDDFWARSAAIKAAGGIAYKDVVEHGRHIIPDGWVIDTQLEFFVPPDFDVTLVPR